MQLLFKFTLNEYDNDESAIYVVLTIATILPDRCTGAQFARLLKSAFHNVVK